MIQENYDITHLTTFGIQVRTKWFAEYASERELLKLSRSEQFLNCEVLHIGAGSNLLFVEDFPGLVLHSAIKGITEYRKSESEIYVIAGAGEVMQDLIDWTINHNLGGLENLTGIPGEVGSAAVQNVGAYGVEAGDRIHSVECFDTQTRKTRRFTHDECCFGYRDSFFKGIERGRYIILRVAFKLINSPVSQTLDYAPLKAWRESLDHAPTLAETSAKIKEIRDSKLPDPKVLGSAGSFFKNPVIPEWLYGEITKHSGLEIPAHKITENGKTQYKLSAAWLIDRAGMKGVSVGGAKVYEKQPLVIVNTGNATAKDVMELAEQVRRAVNSLFIVYLQPEVNYIDTRTRVTVLGTGTSKGIPEMACNCRVCRSEDSHDKRMRCSVYVETQGVRLLIDASPDLRMQSLRNNITDVDAVLITHSHYDHVGGLDDLRPFCALDSLPIFVREDVSNDLHHRVDYCFREHLYPGVPTFDMQIIGKDAFMFKGVKIEPIEVLHGKLPIYGYRIGRFAYITDAKYISDGEKSKLEGVEVLIINALRDKPHFAHFNLEEALALIEEVRPGRAYLTHFNHEMGFHRELEARLPENVFPAYDGLHIVID